MMSSVANQQSNGEGGQGDRDSNTSSVRVLPVRNIIAAGVPSRSTGENVSAGVQPGLDGSVSASEINSRIRELVNNMQGRNQIPSGKFPADNFFTLWMKCFSSSSSRFN